MVKQSAYLETSVISYYTSRFSRDLVVAGHQQITREWLDNYANRFHFFTSEIVIRECSGGDNAAAKVRLSILEDFQIIGLRDDALNLSKHFVKERAVPKKAGEDALHIAIATVHGIDYLVTWNCRHIANAQIRSKLERIANECGYELPTICTPEELMGEYP
jgi:predicted nucleic acid-binding protein